MLREIVLLTLATHEEQRRAGIARAFIASCAVRGVRVWMTEDGRVVRSKGEIGSDLWAVYQIYRDDVIHFLKTQQGKNNGKAANGIGANGVGAKGNHCPRSGTENHRSAGPKASGPCS